MIETYNDYCVKNETTIPYIEEIYNENGKAYMYAYPKTNDKFDEIIKDMHNYIAERIWEEDNVDIAAYYAELASIFNSADIWKTLADTNIFLCTQGKVVYSDDNIIVTITQY